MYVTYSIFGASCGNEVRKHNRNKTCCEMAGLQFLCESQSIVLLRNKGENTYSGGKYMHIIHVAYKQLIYQYLLYL